MLLILVARYRQCARPSARPQSNPVAHVFFKVAEGFLQGREGMLHRNSPGQSLSYRRATTCFRDRRKRAPGGKSSNGGLPNRPPAASVPAQPARLRQGSAVLPRFPKKLTPRRCSHRNFRPPENSSQLQQTKPKNPLRRSPLAGLLSSFSAPAGTTIAARCTT